MKQLLIVGTLLMLIGCASREAEVEDDKRQLDPLENPVVVKGLEGRRLIGDANGKIIIVEFADFQCPACAMGHKWMKEFIKKHADDVQFYFKHMPLSFHEMAPLSAQYFEAIRLQSTEKAMRFQDYVFENQRQLKNEAFLKEAAKAAGADMKKLEGDVNSKTIAELIKSDMEEFQALGFRGTPATIMNGVVMNGAQPVEELERMALRTKRK